MRVEAVSWDDWSTSNAPPVQDAEKWHVALAPDEVKVVSLEQLDDLFRLSIVDAETKVWQPGMVEWLPLRVIAGIEEDAPEPKRNHPKPPTPRSAPPPPPRPQSRAPVAAEPVYAQPPPPRPQSRAPVAAEPVYAQPPPPRPQSRAPVAAEPVYAQPLAFAQTQNAFVAPITPHITSVQPLVVSRPAQPPRTRGGGFGQLLVGLAVLAGVSVTLYRNDVLRDAAHSLHRDALYARLQESLGGPSFGTLASLEQSGTVSSLSAALAAAPAPANEASSVAPSHESSSLPATTGGTPVVSLESLKAESVGARAQVVATHADAPSAVAKPAAQPKPTSQAASAAPAIRAAVAKAEPVAKPAPAQKAAAAPKAAPVKNEADMSPRERLNAAIGASVISTPATNKKVKAKAASEYDPLNPKL